MRSLFACTVIAASLAVVGLGCTNKEEPITLDVVGETISIATLEDGAYHANKEASTIAWSGKKTAMAPHTGKVSLDFADLMIEKNQPAGGSITINMQSITTDENIVLLEEHLKNDDFFAVQTYPISTFTITSITPTSLEPTRNYLATGTMKIRDIEKELSFPINIEQVETDIHITGTIVIDRTDFDIRYNSSSFFENLGDKLIENNFTLTLDLIFNKM